jgi:precorrin-2 dehydrogenase/sirohydrochlorin ferrochelatase
VTDSTSKTEEPAHTSAAKSRLYPAFLALEGKLCVVVGGGRVATRKVHSLLAAGSRVVVISASLHDDLQTLLTKGLIGYIPNNYAAEYLTGASLVFATTNDPEVNLQIMHDAHERGLWVNVADNPDNSDFYVPATISRQDLTLAISTGGGSPAFARYVREVLERSLSEALGQALEIIAQARPLILAEAKERQAQLWESLLALHLETVIETQGYPAARQMFGKWLGQNIGQGDHKSNQDI